MGVIEMQGQPIKKWISQLGAATLLQTSRERVARLASEGHITVQRLPNMPDRYLLADVERLAEGSIIPASAAKKGELLAV